MSARIIAVANQKGGVGKTTTTLALAGALAQCEQRVLAIDLDPHACASMHLRFYPERVRETVYDIFADDGLSGAGGQGANEPGRDYRRAWSRILTRGEGLPFDFAPASPRLAELEIDLATRQGKGVILKDALTVLAPAYDVVLIDCPPHLGILLVNALVASDFVIVPIQTDVMALHGLKLLLQTMRRLNKVLPRPVHYRALATLYDKRASACRRMLELLQEKLGRKLFTTVVDMDTKFREASAHGRLIQDVFPESRGAKEYLALARELMASPDWGAAPPRARQKRR